MPFRFERLALADVVCIEPVVFEDQRGFFSEIYKRSEFEARGFIDAFVQDNYSHSVRGVLRGLHYQRNPKAQAKLVTAIRGEIFDVAVDLRRGSTSYGQWVGVVLSDGNHRMLYVPEGFAHGFCVLSDEADVVYKTTAEYVPDLEAGIIWNDPKLGIRWPIQDPTVSAKDACLPRFGDAVHDFAYAGR